MTEKSMVEKCQSWRGHKFEARYDLPQMTRPVPDFKGAAEDGLELVRLIRGAIYIHDICVRCGKIVKREALKG